MVSDLVTVRSPIAIGAAATNWSASMALIPPCACPAGPTNRRVNVADADDLAVGDAHSTSGRDRAAVPDDRVERHVGLRPRRIDRQDEESRVAVVVGLHRQPMGEELERAR